MPMKGTHDGPSSARARGPSGNPCSIAYAPYPASGDAATKPIDTISQPRVFLGRRLTTRNPTAGKIKSPTANTQSPLSRPAAEAEDQADDDPDDDDHGREPHQPVKGPIRETHASSTTR